MIKVRNLCKTFGSIKAVDDVCFSLKKGEVLGFLGPNGAGKSTTMKMLSGFLAPDSGNASINGCDIISDTIGARKSLGYLAENAPAYEEMTPDSFLNFVCDVRQISGAKRKDNIDMVVDSCSISKVMYQPIGTLSKGFKRRVGLAQALVHDPSVLLLDEPTDGLDPNQKHDVRELIKKLAPNKAIVISTHILEEVEAICSRMIIIAEGKILIDSTPKEVRNEHGGTLDEIFRRVTKQARVSEGAK